MKDEIDLIPTDKCQRFLQIATIILGASGQACPNYSKKTFAIFLQYLKKELINEIDFLHADKYESLLAQLTVWVWCGWPSIPKDPKIASLQCIWISQKRS